jgi:DNA-binding PadR family transcriptional regulator
VFHVLLALHQGPLHGYSIIQDVRQRTGDEIRLTASTLYDALARLVDTGLIEEVAAPAADTQDSRRRYYRITRTGRLAAQVEAQRLDRLLRSARATGVSPRSAR